MKGRYHVATRLPGDSAWIVGARGHRTLASVHKQLRHTAPEWRRVFGPEILFGVHDDKTTNGNGPTVVSGRGAEPRGHNGKGDSAR